MKGSVLLVGSSAASASGSRSVSQTLAGGLASAGWRVLAPPARHGRLARVTGMLATAWRARRDYDLAVVDVYSGLAFRWAEAVCRVLRRAGKPYVLALHGGALPEFGRKQPTRVRRLLDSALAITAPSRYLVERVVPPRDDIRVIPNALRIADYKFRVREAARPRLVWLRGFHEIYDPGLAPVVLAEMHDVPDMRLEMIGPDRGDGSLGRTRRLAERLGVADRIQFSGAVPHERVPEVLDRADIFVNTSRLDNTPVSLLEAMAAGLCIVSTNAGGLAYLLDGCRDALLVPCGDASAMAAAIRRILADRELAAALSRNARRKAESFDWSRVLPLWDALLDPAVR